MKNKHIAICALILLSIIITGVFIAIMPDEVPMHYNLAGEIDRIGSKYENLLYPILSLLVGALFLLMAKYFGKKEDRGNEKVILYSGIALLAFFNVLFFYILWNAAAYIPEISGEASFDSFYQITAIGLGIILIVLGNVMPKTRLNHISGLRTVWSMKNERVWHKTQRFGGIVLFIFGFIIIISGIFIKGFTSIITAICLLLATALIGIIASYRIYKNDLKNHIEK